MSKRFTSTEKWSDPWYRKLSPKHKCLWDWLFTQCDIAGTIEPDFELASFQIGDQVNENELCVFGDRIKVLNGGRLFLIKFLEFQYGELSYECRAHRPVLALIDRLSIPYKYSTNRDKEQEQEQDKEKELDQEQEKDKDKKSVIPKWRENSNDGFKAYLEMSEPAFDALLTDWNWIAIRKEYFPGCCVKRTVYRMWEEFWGTKAGWENKRAMARGKPNYEIDWKLTIERNFKKSICYYGKNEPDDEKTQIEMKRRFGELK